MRTAEPDIKVATNTTTIYIYNINYNGKYIHIWIHKGRASDSVDRGSLDSQNIARRADETPIFSKQRTCSFLIFSSLGRPVNFDVLNAET